MALMAVAAMWGSVGMASAAPLAGAQVCESAKLTAAGKLEQCLAAERAREVRGRTPNYDACTTAFTRAFTTAEAKAGPGICPSEGDAADVGALIVGAFSALRATLAGTPNEPTVPFPSTGQATCWNGLGAVVPCAGTGQDGDTRAGAAPSYIDNGDGTVTDHNTGRMWAKKSDDDSLHDKDNTYTWEDALSVHIAALNAGGGFAGYTDWRLPNVKELESLLNYQNVDPAVSSAFDAGCVAGCTVETCSCTVADDYWTSTTLAPFPTNAFVVGFYGGGVVGSDKRLNLLAVRAVRGGS
jgi:hypothetical protein